MFTTRYGSPRLPTISSSIATIRSCSPTRSSGGEREHLDLVELVDAEHAADVLAVGPGLATEAGRVPRVRSGRSRLVEDLAHAERGERDLRGADEVQLVLGRHVDVHLVRRQEPGPVHRLLADQHRRDHRHEPVGREHVHRVTDERELDVHDVAEQVDEPRAARPGAAVGVEHPEQLAERGVIARLEVERRRLAVRADLDGVLVGEPVRRRVVRDVRRLRRAVPRARPRPRRGSARAPSPAPTPCSPRRSAAASPHPARRRSPCSRGSARRGAPRPAR